MNRIRVVAALAAVAAVGVTGSSLAAEQVLAPKKVTIIMTEYGFKWSAPKTVRKNQKLVVTLVNRGSEVHDLKFNGVTPKSRFLPGGGRQTFTVVFKKTGRVQYVCTIGEHAIKGMLGVLVVKP